MLLCSAVLGDVHTGTSQAWNTNTHMGTHMAYAQPHESP